MSKKHGLWASKTTKICCIRLTGSSCGDIEAPPQDFDVIAARPGKLLAANQRLCEEPEMLWSRPHDFAHIVIMALFDEEQRRLLETGLTADEFCARRQLPLHMLRPRRFSSGDYKIVFPDESGK
jgi:hypothetical protein